jgi:hypothetical protein
MYWLIIVERITVRMTLGMITFSPLSYFSCCVPNATSWWKYGLLTKYMKWSSKVFGRRTRRDGVFVTAEPRSVDSSMPSCFLYLPFCNFFIWFNIHEVSEAFWPCNWWHKGWESAFSGLLMVLTWASSVQWKRNRSLILGRIIAKVPPQRYVQ